MRKHTEMSSSCKIRGKKFACLTLFMIAKMKYPQGASLTKIHFFEQDYKT